MQIAMHSAVGPRENLEDAAMAGTVVADEREVPILVVCDGVGGHDAGEIASAAALASILSYLVAHLTPLLIAGNNRDNGVSETIAGVWSALVTANEAVLQCAASVPARRSMATTAVCGVIVHDTLVVGWAGDSRCYLHTAEGLQRVTDDHSQVAELINLGLIRADEAMTHPSAHTVTRYLGQPSCFEPCIRTCPITPGDIVLLCSDGLTDVMNDDEIGAEVELVRDGHIGLDELPRRLVRQALAAGTQDNTTVLCFLHESAAARRDPRRTLTQNYLIRLGGSEPGLFLENNYGHNQFCKTSARRRTSERACR